MVDSACDRCGRSMDRLDRQYLATIDVRPIVSAANTEEDPGDRDHLLELHEMLEAGADETDIDLPQTMELVLCHECCQRVFEDPVPQETAVHLGFSQN